MARGPACPRILRRRRLSPDFDQSLRVLHRSAQSAQHLPDENDSDSLCAVRCFDCFQRACNPPRLPTVIAV